MINRLSSSLQAVIGRQEDLFTTMRNAGGVFGIRFSGAVVNFLFTLVLVRFLPKEQVGFTLATMSMVQIAALGVTLNIENGAVRHLVRAHTHGRLGEASGFMHHALSIVARVSFVIIPVFVGWSMFVHFSGGTAIRTEIIAVILAALAIPILGLLRIGAASGHALGRIISSLLPTALIQPLSLVTLTAVAGIVMTDLSVGRVMLFYFLSMMAALLLQGLLIGRTFAFMSETPERDNKGDWVRTGVYLSVNYLLLTYAANVAVVVGALVLDDAAIAMLAIAFRFVVLLRMGVMAINAAIGPAVSRGIAAGEMGRVARRLRMAAHLKFWPTLAGITVVWLLAPWLIPLAFGADYQLAAEALRWLAVIPLMSAIFGPSLMILNISGHQARIVPVSLICLALLVVAVPTLASLFGAVGAAMAAVLALGSWEAALYALVRQKTPLRPAIFDTLQPLPPAGEPAPRH